MRNLELRLVATVGLGYGALMFRIRLDRFVCVAVLLVMVGCANEQTLEPIPAPADVAAPPSDSQRTGTGLAYKVLVAADGVKPTVSDRVNVHYTGWTTDGEMFDSSVARGSSATFAVNGVIDGWVEGLQLMNEGSTYRLWIPESLAYRGVAGRPAGMLVFDVQLLTVYPQQ